LAGESRSPVPEDSSRPEAESPLTPSTIGEGPELEALKEIETEEREDAEQDEGRAIDPLSPDGGDGFLVLSPGSKRGAEDDMSPLISKRSNTGGEFSPRAERSLPILIVQSEF